MSSLTQPKENLVLVHQSNDPDLPQSIFEDLGHLAQETGRTVEAMFLFSQSGENRIKTASKYTVKADGKVIQDSWVDNLHMPVSRQFFSGTNKRVSLKDTK